MIQLKQQIAASSHLQNGINSNTDFNTQTTMENQKSKTRFTPGDLTSDEDRSRIADFYDNRSVLITGASGFLGKILIEKLIRTCPRLRNVFVLIRPKWNKEPKERLAELLAAPLFDKLREKGLLKQVVLIEGDVTQPNFGMSAANLLRIMNEVSVIFHSAATVKFDDPMKQSIGINIAGAKNMIDICRKIPQLAAVVHVSTAYANCNESSIDEHVYPVDMDPERLIEMANWLDQETLQELKKRLLGPRPNTYTYTKALGEWLIYKCARDLPVVICRPSIVVASWKEPFSGWIDNFNGPTGVILGAGKGLIRSMLCEPSYVADLVPADTVINLIVSLGWFANVYYNHRRQNDSLDSLVESPFSSTSVASSVVDENNQSYIVERVQYLADSEQVNYQQRLNDRFNHRLQNSHSQKSLIEENHSSSDDNNKDSFGTQLDDKYSSAKTSSILLNNNNSVSNCNEFYSTLSSDKQSSSPVPQARSLITQLTTTNSDYGSNRSQSDTNSLHSTSRSSPSEPQLHPVQEDHKIFELDVSNGDNNEVEDVKRLLQLEDQNRSDFEYKLKQFRHDTRARLIAKNLPEDIADVPVFHCTSGKENPLTWGRLQVLILAMWAIYPSISTYRFPAGSFTNKRRLDKFYRTTLHYIPAHIVDFFTKLFGGKPVLVNIFKKFDQAAGVLEAFTLGQWTFANDNRLTIVNELMTEKDKQLFNCDLSELNWDDFCKDYVLGTRRFLLKESIDNLDTARRKLKVVYLRNLSLQVLFFAIAIYTIMSWI